MESLYHANQVEAVINECGLEIRGETENDFQCYCPYHGNRFTPSFNVSKVKGSFVCFNPSCAVKGSLIQLVKDTTKKGEFQSLRLIVKHKKMDSSNFQERLLANMEAKPQFVEFPSGKIEELYERFWEYSDAVEYMIGRGFEEETLHEFKVGYSAVNDVVTVPMYDPTGMPIGVIGRSIEGKRFKNSKGLPKSKTVWNLHRAKAHDSIILTEASFDGMFNKQSGYPNTGGLLGGFLSEYQVNLLERYFDTIIIMTDNDLAGRTLGDDIAKRLSRKRVRWAVYDDNIVYPPGVKDSGDMDDDLRKHIIKNSISTFEYWSWGVVQLYDGAEYKLQTK